MELNIYDIIVGPVVTNKAYRLYQTLKQVTLHIHPEANKSLVSDAMRKIFNVEVEKVRTFVRKGKRKLSRSRNESFDNLRKIAIVSLKNGQDVNFFGDVTMASENEMKNQAGNKGPLSRLSE